MKILYSIPTYNEELHIGETLGCLFANIDHIKPNDILIVDDNSFDETINIIKSKSNRVLIHKKLKRKGIVDSFNIVRQYALENQYDYMILIDGDNQYDTGSIMNIVGEIIEKKVDLGIGYRNIKSDPNYNITKRLLHKFGNIILNKIFKTKIKDFPCGFRIYSRNILLSTNLVSSFSYVIETVVIAKNKKLKTYQFSIKTNKVKRPSRLFSSYFHYISRHLVDSYKIISSVSSEKRKKAKPVDIMR